MNYRIALITAFLSLWLVGSLPQQIRAQDRTDCDLTNIIEEYTNSISESSTFDELVAASSSLSNTLRLCAIHFDITANSAEQKGEILLNTLRWYSPSFNITDSLICSKLQSTGPFDAITLITNGTFISNVNCQEDTLGENITCKYSVELQEQYDLEVQFEIEGGKLRSSEGRLAEIIQNNLDTASRER